MKPYLTSRQFARVATIIFVVVAITVAVVRCRRSEDAAIVTPMERGKMDGLISELARCRTITSDDLGLLESCHHVWAENRQHFFQSAKSPPSPAMPAPDASAEPTEKRARSSLDGIERGGAR
jgi:conjugative transfer region protein TrbK